MLKGLDQVQQNLDRYYTGALRRAATAMEEIAAILEGYAKSSHPWTEDTGNTAKSIRGFISEVTPKIIRVTLSAGMEYDVFLELAREGKWAWLWPAIEANLDTIKRKLEGIRQ